ncbi:MAG: RnfABCDGE type electron transport complex subunit D, partial [Clostridia bacterium]|nr:RnfABCDGE type electron transport complex subunit D [Clostridia bacterium]
MLKNINVSVSPHIRTKDTTSRIMLDVCIALLFPLGAGVYAFGISALYVILVSVISCVLSEYIYQKLMRKPNVKFSRQKTSIGDLSAVVTGLILAVNLPSTVPLWVPAIGGVFAIVVVKQLFGGLGQNFMNPALAARCFLLISLAGIMTKFPTEVNHFFPVADAVSTATPMGMLKLGETTDWFNMVFNTHSGCIGEASALAVLIGALYM